ncbi:MAG: hypothetical protein Tsb0010_19720 [Parvularculaceae bacterium]
MRRALDVTEERIKRLRNMRWALWALVALVAAGAAAGVALRTASNDGDPRLADQVEIGGPFALTDQYGEARTNADFRGRLMLIYFGYASCPDVCPMALNRMSAALNELNDRETASVAPIFVTVDPERDTVETLRDYLSFDPRLIGLTGEPEAIAQAKQSFRVYSRKSAEETALGYLVDHSSLFYLMDRKGAFAELIDDEAAPTDIAAMIRKHL